MDRKWIVLMTMLLLMAVLISGRSTQGESGDATAVFGVS